MRIKDYSLAFERSNDTSAAGTPLVIYRMTIRSKLLDGEIRATALGVNVSGRFPTMTTEECVVFEETIARARVQAKAIVETGATLSDAECDAVLMPKDLN